MFLAKIYQDLDGYFRINLIYLLKTNLLNPQVNDFYYSRVKEEIDSLRKKYISKLLAYNGDQKKATKWLQNKLNAISKKNKKLFLMIAGAVIPQQKILELLSRQNKNPLHLHYNLPSVHTPVVVNLSDRPVGPITGIIITTPDWKIKIGSKGYDFFTLPFYSKENINSIKFNSKTKAGIINFDNFHYKYRYYRGKKTEKTDIDLIALKVCKDTLDIIFHVFNSSWHDSYGGHSADYHTGFQFEIKGNALIMTKARRIKDIKTFLN